MKKSNKKRTRQNGSYKKKKKNLEGHGQSQTTGPDLSGK
jgi:hypothetical protein